jgi:hypothetical protein
VNHRIYVSGEESASAACFDLCTWLETQGFRCWTPLRESPGERLRGQLPYYQAMDCARVALIIDCDARLARWQRAVNTRGVNWSSVPDNLITHELRHAESHVIPIVKVSLEDLLLKDDGALVAAIEAAVASRTNDVRIVVYAPAERRAAELAGIEEQAIVAAGSVADRVRFTCVAADQSTEPPAPDDLIVLVVWDHIAACFRSLAYQDKKDWLPVFLEDRTVLVHRTYLHTFSGLSAAAKLERMSHDCRDLSRMVERALPDEPGGIGGGAGEHWLLRAQGDSDDPNATLRSHLLELTWKILEIRRPSAESQPNVPQRFRSQRVMGYGPPPEPPPPTPRDHICRAHYAAFAPEQVSAGEAFIVDLWVCPAREEAYLDVLKRAKKGSADVVQVGHKDGVPTRSGVWLEVSVRVPGLQVRTGSDRMFWDGKTPANASFEVLAPDSLQSERTVGTALISCEGVPVATLLFLIRLGRARMATRVPLNAKETQIREIFASYARPDRAEVLRWARAAKALGVDVFVDVLSLREGEDWAERLFDEVPRRDLLWLFWSRPARESDWVEMEWRCALAARGIDYIHPIALVDPELVPPPSELAARHFGDPLLRVLIAEEDRRARHTSPK